MIRQSRKILRELDIPETNEDYIQLRKLVGNNLGYLGEFTQWLFRDNTPLSQLDELLRELRSIKIDKPISYFDTSESLYDYITEMKANIQVNQVIQELPRHAKNVVTDKLRNLIKNNLEHVNLIKDFYSTKGSRYRDPELLYHDTVAWIGNITGGWNVDSIEYLPEELVYKDDFTLILHISNYNRSYELGSTMWCICTSENYWIDYTSDFRKQYFIYDFTRGIGDNKSMIGVTINLDGSISAAHLRNDDKANYSEITNEYGEYLTPYGGEYIKSRIDINNFHEVSRYGLTEEVRRLINQGYDPSTDNNLAIRVASRDGHTEVVKLLLQDKRVDPSVDNNYAIIWSSRYGHLEVVKELLKDKRVTPGINTNRPIRWASANGHTEVVKELLKDDRVAPSDSDNHAIRWASESGHVEVVEELLKDERVDPSANDNEAIRYASRNGHLEVVKLLLKDERVDPSVNNNLIMRYASSNGHLEVVGLLLQDNRVDPSDNNNFAIRWASQKGYLDVVKELLKDKRVDPSASNNFAMRYASSNGHLEVVKLLLKDERVDPSVNNNVIMRWATQEGHLDIVNLIEQLVKND